MQIGNPSSGVKLEVKVTTIKRRIEIEGNLYFEYEVSPHRAILARRSEIEANDLSSGTVSCQASNGFSPQNLNDNALLDKSKRAAGFHIPFKQVRLKGQINPLKPPLDVETVLIGRALGQPTGYLAGRAACLRRTRFFRQAVGGLQRASDRHL
jgi:hypothetical protein